MPMDSPSVKLPISASTAPSQDARSAQLISSALHAAKTLLFPTMHVFALLSTV